MLQTLRWFAIIAVPSLAIGIPAGMLLGNYAAGDASSVIAAGYLPPDAGAETQSASAADALQPAQAAFIPEDRYVQAAQRFAD